MSGELLPKSFGLTKAAEPPDGTRLEWKRILETRCQQSTSSSAPSTNSRIFPTSKIDWMPVFPVPDTSSAMTDTWPTMARYSTFSPESDNTFSSSPNYSNGNLTNLRTMSDQSSIESFKDRHNRLMSTENEKNKLIEVGIPYLPLFSS